MSILFYISSIIAIVSTILAITRYQPIHALLYLVVSFLAVAMIFLSLGAPFMAVLEVIIYAGAIVVLVIFVVMMLNLGKDTAQQEKEWLKPRVWLGPSILVLILQVELIVLLLQGTSPVIQVTVVDPKKIAISLFTEYILALELTGFLLMAGIVGAAHIGKHKKKNLHRFLQDDDGTIREVEKTPHPQYNTEPPIISNP
jgi:NADH-quinone oxidoreductase subunit J